jgi:hypothetical protein
VRTLQYKNYEKFYYVIYKFVFSYSYTTYLRKTTTVLMFYTYHIISYIMSYDTVCTVYRTVHLSLSLLSSFIFVQSNLSLTSMYVCLIDCFCVDAAQYAVVLVVLDWTDHDRPGTRNVLFLNCSVVTLQLCINVAKKKLLCVPFSLRFLGEKTKGRKINACTCTLLSLVVSCCLLLLVVTSCL